MNAAGGLLLLVFPFSLLFGSKSAMSNECNESVRSDAISSRIVSAALNEHAVFNGHRIDANGRLWKFGATETENEFLLDPATDEPGVTTSRRLAWRRVWEYWRVLDTHVPGIAMSRKVISFSGVLSDELSNTGADETRLSELFSLLEEDQSPGKESLRQAAVRAALSDSPWSAAFISYLMHQAGLDTVEFRYAAAHWQYVKQAFDDNPRHAYRACDPRRTQPRNGDLLCYSRGQTSPNDFAAWRDTVMLPGFSAASHCEVVVRVDRAASKIDTVGGNVLQSVAMRRLKLNREGVLSAAHYQGGEEVLSAVCARNKNCRDENLNTQRWSVLLQLR
jgi:hypothetical protein